MRWQLAVAALPFLSAGAFAADIKGTSKIDQVTVFPTGAEVTRLAKVKIERGEHVLLFADLPARALPGSIRVEGKANARLAISSVDTRRTFVPRDDAAAAASERKRLEDEIEKLGDERAKLSASIEALEAQKTFIASLAKMPAQSAPVGQTAQQPDWEKLIGFIGQRLAEAQKGILDTQLKVREVDRQIKDLQGKLAALAPRQDERTEVKIFVNAGAALDADLTIRYQVGNASWTPYYDARLTTGSKTQGPKLGFERRASIQQRSGESWDDVLLALSTTRPGSNTSAPEITTQTIDYVPDTPPPPPPRPMAAPMAPMAQRTVGIAPGAAKVGAGVDEERARTELTVAEQVNSSVDAQGYQAVYGIASRVSVPATGEAKRVQIDATDLDPALLVRTVPKRDTTAFLYAKAPLSKGTPVLPGVVSLFRDGTFVGTGQLPLLPPGEEHELGFGADDAVRVKYAIVEEKRGETGLISSSKTDVRSWRISVKNLRERPIAVSVIDQIPVSQNQDVKVELTGKTAPTKRDLEDKRGVLAWDLDVKPDEEKVIEFGYRASWPSAKRVQYGN